MSNVPSELQYTKEHEWVRIDGNSAVVGITEHAQRELGDVVFVELPEIGQRFEVGDSFGSVESVKAVSDIYAPLSGEISEINSEVVDSPELVNQEPYGDGWLVKFSFTTAPSGLLSADAYQEYLNDEANK